MELYEIVMKLAGPIQPTGEHETDQRRLENLESLTELIYRLLLDISDAAKSADRPEASMKAIGSYARGFLNDLG